MKLIVNDLGKPSFVSLEKLDRFGRFTGLGFFR